MGHGVRLRQGRGESGMRHGRGKPSSRRQGGRTSEGGRRRPTREELRDLVEQATVELVDLTNAEEVVVVCRREGVRQRIPVLDLPLPDPPPEGWQWIEAYRHWARG